MTPHDSQPSVSVSSEVVIGVAVRHLASLIEADLNTNRMYLTEAEYHAEVRRAFQLLDRAEAFLGASDALYLADCLHTRLCGPSYAAALLRQDIAYRRLADLREGR